MAPQEEGEDSAALVQAAMRPKMIGDFFRKYDRAKLPSHSIGANVLVGMGAPKERAEQAFNLIVETGKFTGIITENRAGSFVAIATATNPVEAEAPGPRPGSKAEGGVEDEAKEFARRVAGEPTAAPPAPTTPPVTNRVYISHGKYKEIVRQLKEILTFGKYAPVASVEIETTSVPVPDKVMEDMRCCGAGIINVHPEGEWLDREGNKHIKINDNVLIEIGAAMALYRKKYILLVQKGVALPSNLQGLYRVDYEGEKLDFETTMRLLRAFNEFDKI